MGLNTGATGSKLHVLNVSKSGPRCPLESALDVAS